MTSDNIVMPHSSGGIPESDIKISFGNVSNEKSEDSLQVENKNYCNMSFGVYISSSEGKNNQIDMCASENLNNFNLNNRMWNDEKQFDSFNNYESGYFDEIVKMGEDAIPYILAELEKGPSPIVHALDLIYPGKIKYNGFVPLKVACEKWISILKKTENL